MKRLGLCAFLLSVTMPLLSAAGTPQNVSRPITEGLLPLRIHVFEDFETEIEKRWWLRGIPESNNLGPSLSWAVPNQRACLASASKDFDDKMGDPSKEYKAVVFNPVPGPPMGANTRLSFRYWVSGTDMMRVQIYSLSQNYHRFLTLTGLIQGSWQAAAVDMTQARRPDGSGGPLAADERIDDIQFYITPEAELIIDDIVLYDAAPAGEEKPFPARIVFTGWFDTGQRGSEWPGDFEIVPHQAPLTWKAAQSVLNAKTGAPWIRVQMRGEHPLSAVNHLRFRYRLVGTRSISVTLANNLSGEKWNGTLNDATSGSWAEATLSFPVEKPGALANELYFAVTQGADLQIDDVLLFEPLSEHAVVLQTEKLRAVVANNESFGPDHRAGYNGVAELELISAPLNLFVPHYAGLNLEHIFSGDSRSFEWDIFEPRRAPMQFVRRSPTRVELHQESTQHWPLRSRLTYEVEGDAVNLTYCGTPLEDAWSKHGYIGVFFASYIQKPEDLSIQFIGRARAGRGDTRPRWIKHLSPTHGLAANHRPAGSSWDPPFDDGFGIVLAKGISDFEYLYPFYFGRSGDNVFIMMFERPRHDGELRFAQSPSGGGSGNPAWDFFWLQRGYVVGQQFCFRARAVLAKFTSIEDIIQRYEKWSGEGVNRPQASASSN